MRCVVTLFFAIDTRSSYNVTFLNPTSPAKTYWLRHALLWAPSHSLDKHRRGHQPLLPILHVNLADGARDRIWTGDLSLTMGVLYLLSYVGNTTLIFFRNYLDNLNEKSEKHNIFWQLIATINYMIHKGLHDIGAVVVRTTGINGKQWRYLSVFFKLCLSPHAAKTVRLRQGFGVTPRHSSRRRVELVIGFEPTTCWLQISCSTNWATPAYYIKVFHPPRAFAHSAMAWQAGGYITP